MGGGRIRGQMREEEFKILGLRLVFFSFILNHRLIGLGVEGGNKT